MVYNTIYDQNVTSLSGIFAYVSETVPVFVPMMLFSIFLIVTFATHFSQVRMRGYSNIWNSIAVAGYFVAVISVIMSLIPGLINPYYVVVCIVVAVISTGILFAQPTDK